MQWLAVTPEAHKGQSAENQFLQSVQSERVIYIIPPYPEPQRTSQKRERRSGRNGVNCPPWL